MSGIEGFRTQKEHGESSWFGFSLILEGKLKGLRRELIAVLTRAGIESRPIVTGNFTRNPVISHLDHAPIGALPGSDEVHDDGLFIGNHHYDLSMELGHIYHTSKVKGVAFTRLAKWYDKVEKSKFKSFNTIAKSIQEHYLTILNYFDNRSTNASAESFNAKIKAFRSSFRGVRNVSFFLFRLANIYA